MTDTSSRKEEHLSLCLDSSVESLDQAGFAEITLPHVAMPEINFQDVSLETELLGETFSAPLMVSSMTGGSPRGEALNARLAVFAERHRLPMGVGSQRVALENRDKNYFSLRSVAPRATLLANLGAVQLNYGVSPDDCAWLVERLEASALILHLNPLQEAIQLEGNRNFSALLPKITAVKQRLPSTPIVLKETGCGLDVGSARRALSAGVDVLDIAGLGGTHWGFIEGLRASAREPLGKLFRNWGLPTAKQIVALREALGPEVPLIASGGVRDPLDVAKALYLGADFCAMALPFLRAAERGDEALDETYEFYCEALRVALFCTGTQKTRELRHAKQSG